MESYELAWAEALAREHAHQRELLATLQGELWTFANECASALTALDAVVGVAGIGTMLDTAGTALKDAALVRDVGRRISGLARVDRSDRELLQAIAGAADARARLEQVVGQAPVAALSALAPLAHWAPSLRRGGGRALVASARADLTQVLESTAALGDRVGADAADLAESLRDTVEHVQHAARAISDGKLKEALAAARAQLEADLADLRTAHEQARAAPASWRTARRVEHAELTEEVRRKLDKVERIRGALGLLLPHLQLVGRTLVTVEKLRSLANRIDPPAATGVEAARLSLLLSAAEAWEASLPDDGTRRAVTRSSRRRWLVLAALAAVAAIVGIALGLSGGSTKKHAATLPVTHAITAYFQPPPPATAPKVSPVHSVFDPTQKTTFYSISVQGARPGSLQYSWHLTPPKNDPTCNKFGTLPGAPNRAAWHHADTDGCNHAVMGRAGHLGTVTVTVSNAAWSCTASFFGTNTSTGSPPKACKKI